MVPTRRKGAVETLLLISFADEILRAGVLVRNWGGELRLEGTAVTTPFSDMETRRVISFLHITRR